MTERTREPVSERIQAEVRKALHDPQEKYARIFLLSPDAININRLSDGMYIDINRGFTAITGYTAEEVIGRSSLPGDLGLWVDAADRERLVHLLRTQGEALHFESRFRCKDGSLIFGLMSARVIEIDGVPCVLSITRDISDRKRAEAALRLSEERYRSVVEVAVDAILLGDAQGGIIAANQRAADLTGYTVDELLRLNISQLFTPEERQRKPLRYDLLKAGQVVGTERTLTRKDGSGVAIEMRSKMMPDGTYQAFIRDISLRLQLEAERARAEQRLGESQKLEALGQLAGGIAHDFNNQLAGILGNAELLSERLHDPNLRRFADRIITAAERSAALTRQLLAFARKGRHVTVAVDIHRLIGEVVELLSHSLDKRIAIRQLLEATDATILGDPDQLQNALANLAINARDAMPEGGELLFATADCAAAPGLPPGRCLRLAIVDTGTGMDEETQRHLFEPFFTTKPPGKGTGLGLASVYGTVQDHHGAITIGSRPGHGTSVVIHLPLPIPGEPATPAGRQPGAILPKRPAGTPGRILLVDDEDCVRDITAEMLRSLGYAVCVCPDGAAAVERYRHDWRDVDLVILDLIMPVMSGQEAFAAMQAINPGLRALIISGHSLEGVPQDLLRAGALGFMPKPFSFSQLGERVGAILGRLPP